MTVEYVDLKESMTVRDAIERIRKIGLDKETVNVCYVVDPQRVLLGTTPTRAFGHGYTKVYVDENQGTFFVTRESNYMAHNPDVFSVSQVIGVRPSIHENRTELYHHDREGRRVPYNPRRYQVDYRFNVAIDLNTPFCNRLRPRRARRRRRARSQPLQAQAPREGRGHRRGARAGARPVEVRMRPDQLRQVLHQLRHQEARHLPLRQVRLDARRSREAAQVLPKLRRPLQRGGHGVTVRVQSSEWR